RGTADTVADVLPLVVCEDVDRPEPPARATLQAVQDSRSPDRVHFAIRDRRRSPRSRATQTRIEQYRIGMHPHLGPVGYAVTNDAFFRPSLLLCDRVATHHSERAPAAADWLPPNQARRSLVPVTGQPCLRLSRRALGPEELGIVVFTNRWQDDISQKRSRF